MHHVYQDNTYSKLYKQEEFKLYLIMEGGVLKGLKPIQNVLSIQEHPFTDLIF